MPQAREVLCALVARALKTPFKLTPLPPLPVFPGGGGWGFHTLADFDGKPLPPHGKDLVQVMQICPMPAPVRWSPELRKVKKAVKYQFNT